MGRGRRKPTVEKPKYSKALGFWYTSEEEYESHPLRKQSKRSHTKEKFHIYYDYGDTPRYSNKYGFWSTCRREYFAKRSVICDYGLSLEKYTEMWEIQKGICLGCDIKLVSSVFVQEQERYKNDPNLISGVHYSKSNIDHDHLLDKDDPKYVRGLLCTSCNNYTKDVLNPDSKWYIYGKRGGKNKTMLILERKILRSWVGEI